MIFKTNLLIYQSKADLDEKIVFCKIIRKNACKGFVWESRIPCSILVHDLCGIEVYIASLRNGI